MEFENLQKKVEEFAKRADEIKGEQEYKNVLDEIRRAKVSVEKYQDELDNLDTKYMNNVESVKAERELKDTVAEAQKRVDELEAQKAKLDEERKTSDTKKKESELRDERSKFYTQEKMRLEQELRKVKYEMEGINIQVHDFKFEYVVKKDEEGNEHNIPTNGDELKKLNEQYDGLKDKLKDIQDALKLCEDKKAEVQQEFEDAVKPINDAISRDSSKQEENKDEDGKGKDDKDGEGKDGEGKDGEGKDGEGKDGEGKDGKGKDGKGKDGEGKDGKNLPIINGENEYAQLGIINQYKVKKAAYKIENELSDESDIKWYQKIRLFLPNQKAKEASEKYISNGKIKINKYEVDRDSEEISQEDYERDPFQKQDKTPKPEKGNKQPDSKEKDEKDDEARE
jgi:chromosome segregation ATPase